MRKHLEGSRSFPFPDGRGSWTVGVLDCWSEQAVTFGYTRAGCFSSIYRTILPRTHEIIYPRYPRRPQPPPGFTSSVGVRRRAWRSCSSSTLYIDVYITEHLLSGKQRSAGLKKPSVVHSQGTLCSGSWEHQTWVCLSVWTAVEARPDSHGTNEIGSVQVGRPIPRNLCCSGPLNGVPSSAGPISRLNWSHPVSR